TPTMELQPTPVVGEHRFTDLQAGQAHACGIESGAVLCWGSTEYGATTGVLAGNAMKACVPSLDCDLGAPKQLNFFPANATKLATGALHTCVLHAGTVTCWGDNSKGQLASSNPAPPRERDITAPGAAPWADLLQTGRDAQCGVYKNGGND